MASKTAQTAHRLASILIVDDDSDLTTLLAMFLNAKGYAVETAADGQACLQKVARERPDLILLDNEMPVLDGPQTLERLHADPATADIPVIMVSGRLEHRDRKAAQVYGSTDYVAKPFDYDRLLERIMRILP